MILALTKEQKLYKFLHLLNCSVALMVLQDKMTVMQVRPNYSIVYQFKPLLKVERKHVKTIKHFTGFIKDIAANWKDGDYFLKTPKGTFAYFNLEGNRVKLVKKSKIGKEYLCWQYFGPGNSGKKKA